MATIKLVYGVHEVEVPEELLKMENFLSILDWETWTNIFDDDDRQELGMHLPSNMDPDETVGELLSGGCARFVDPVVQFEKMARDGKFTEANPELSVAHVVKSDDSSQRLRREQLQPTLSRLTMKRAELLQDNIDPAIALEHIQGQCILRKKRIRERVTKRLDQMEAKQEHCSDKVYNYKRRCWGAGQDLQSVWETTLYQDTAFSGKLPKSITRNDLKNMLRAHRQAVHVLGSKPYVHPLPLQLQLYRDSKAAQTDMEGIVMAVPQRKYMGCFFFLLHRLLWAMPGHQAQLRQLEEAVAVWMKRGKEESAATGQCLSWERLREWDQLVKSAMCHMAQPREGEESLVVALSPVRKDLEASRDSLKAGLKHDSASPTTWWSWVGPAMTHQQLQKWQNTWPDNPSTPAGHIDGHHAHHRIKPLSAQQIEDLHAQERERFMNPCKSFIYRMPAYQVTVAPVKGCTPETIKRYASVLPRKHSSLVADRPPWVTAQALVRDAVARLPDGVGVRSEVLELLRQSQYIVAGVPEEQLHIVVSGGLDRMSTETHPCVRFDQEKKHWVYRYRTDGLSANGMSADSHSTNQQPAYTLQLPTTVDVPIAAELDDESETEAAMSASPTNSITASEIDLDHGPAHRRLAKEMADVFNWARSTNQNTLESSDDDVSLASEDTDGEDMTINQSKSPLIHSRPMPGETGGDIMSSQ